MTPQNSNHLALFIMFAQMFAAVVSVVDVTVTTVTSTVQVIAGQKTAAEAVNAVVETVTESPVVKSVTFCPQLAVFPFFV